MSSIKDQVALSMIYWYDGKINRNILLSQPVAIPILVSDGYSS